MKGILKQQTPDTPCWYFENNYFKKKIEFSFQLFECECSACGSQNRATTTLGSGVTGGCQSPVWHGCWEPLASSGPLPGLYLLSHLSSR